MRQPGQWALKEFHTAALASAAYAHPIPCTYTSQLVPLSKLACLAAATWTPQLFSEHSKALERAQVRVCWTIQDWRWDDLEPAAAW